MLIDMDIFSFLKADQYARAFEKEEDKLPRSQGEKDGQGAHVGHNLNWSRRVRTTIDYATCGGKGLDVRNGES